MYYRGDCQCSLTIYGRIVSYKPPKNEFWDKMHDFGINVAFFYAKEQKGTKKPRRPAARGKTKRFLRR